MSAVEQIEEAVRKLSNEDRVAFRAWFAEFDAAEWDRKLEMEIHLAGPPVDVPDELQAEFEAWGHASDKALDLVERSGQE